MNKSINPDTRKPVEYVNKEAMYAALQEYKIACKANPDNIPRVPEYIGECIVKIAEGMAKRPNFNRYSWIDDMKGDGIETCLKYVKSFDPEKSKNPFGYFSQVVWYSFISRIQSEKKQSKIKREIVRHANFDTMTLQEHDSDGEFTANINEFLASIGDDAPVDVPTPKAVPKGKLESFFDKE